MEPRKTKLLKFERKGGRTARRECVVVDDMCVIYKAQKMRVFRRSCPLVGVCDTIRVDDGETLPHVSNKYNEVTFASPNHDESRRFHGTVKKWKRIKQNK